MRVSREQAQRNREHVVEVSSRLFRERGFDGIGVDDLMKEAGLTRGGFYGQFKSKEDLKVEASRRAFSMNKDKISKVVAETAEGKLAALAKFYLSEPISAGGAMDARWRLWEAMLPATAPSCRPPSRTASKTTSPLSAARCPTPRPRSSAANPSRP